MALFGFAINFNDGCTDYVVVSAPDLATAEGDLAATVDCEGVESVVHYDAETILCEQYDGLAFLTSEYHVVEE
jgi:hypothetical protein